MKLCYSILLSASLTFPALLPAQSWFENNPQWINYMTLGWGGPAYEYMTVQGDTVVGGKAAKRLYRVIEPEWGSTQTYTRAAYQNGDTVWCWNSFFQHYFIHYNFSLQPGDTVQVPVYQGFFTYIIDSTGTVQIGSENLRFQRVRTPYMGPNGPVTVYAAIVEKMGMVDGRGLIPSPGPMLYMVHFFLDEPNMGFVDGADWYFCRYQNDQFVYAVPASYCQDLVDAPEVAPQAAVQIAPNPFSDRLRIVCETPLQGANLRLYSSSGRLVRQAGLSGTLTEIQTSDLPCGFYFWEITTGSGRVHSGKAVKTE